MEGKWIALVAIVGIIGTIWYVNENPEILEDANVTSVSEQRDAPEDNEDSSSGAIQTYSGDLSIDNTLNNELNATDTLADVTNVEIKFYEKIDGDYFKRATSASNTATVQVDETISKMYMGIDIPASQTGGKDYYVCVACIVEQNKRVSTPFWLDLNNDGLGEWIFPVDVTDVAGTQRETQTPSFTLNLGFWSMIAANGAASDMTVLGTADTLSVGTTANTEKTLRFGFDFEAAGHAVGIRQILLSVNSTDSDRYSENSYLAIPWEGGTKKIKLSEFQDKDVGASAINYTYTFGSGELNDAWFITVPKTGDVRVDLPFYATVSFTNDECTEWLLNLKYLNGRQATSQLKDVITLYEDSTRDCTA